MNLEFENIGHHYGTSRALANINLTARSGEVTCLLGPSGCGKTTLLNLAAGLLDVQQGRIALDQEVLAEQGRNPPPEQRPIGLVFQDGALFPHMSIADNILFGVSKALRSQETAEQWLEMIGLQGLSARYPAQLSGGQQQRVALARAMAAQPAVLLLDEPFASIDVVLRRSLRRECRTLLKARGATAIMVTHDPEEAIDIGDRIAVMEDGAIVQADTPQALFDSPASLSVAAMFGDNQTVPAMAREDGLETAFGLWPAESLAAASAQVSAQVSAQSGAIQLLVREGALEAIADPAGFAAVDMRQLGRSTQLTLAAEGGAQITLTLPADFTANGSDRFILRPKKGSILAFPQSG